MGSYGGATLASAAAGIGDSGHRGPSGRTPAPDGSQTPFTQASAGPHRLRQPPSTQSSQALESQRLWQAPPAHRMHGPHVSTQPCGEQVWQTGSQNGLSEPDWQLRHWP